MKYSGEEIQEILYKITKGHEMTANYPMVFVDTLRHVYSIMKKNQLVEFIGPREFILYTISEDYHILEEEFIKKEEMIL